MSREDELRPLVQAALTFAGTMNAEGQPKAVALLTAAAAMIRELCGPAQGAIVLRKLTGQMIAGWEAAAAVNDPD